MEEDCRPVEKKEFLLQSQKKKKHFSVAPFIDNGKKYQKHLTLYY